MRLALIAAIPLYSCAVTAVARTPLPPIPHDPTLARCVIEQFVEAINSRDLTRISSSRIFADEIGRVSDHNVETFLGSFDVGSKLSDRDPLSVGKIAVLEVDGVSPIYMAILERKYAADRYWSVWLFQFKSDEIVLARRADELWPLLERGSFAFAPCEVAEAGLAGPRR